LNPAQPCGETPRDARRERACLHDADTGALDDSQRWLACWMVALCYIAHAIVHVAYAEVGAGRTAWLIAARKLRRSPRRFSLARSGEGYRPSRWLGY